MSISALDFAEHVWSISARWDRFARDTVGRQLVRSADSISANISEGFGRYHFKENRQFCYYSRGSCYESFTWIEKAARRELLTDDEAASLQADLMIILKMLNAYIRTIGKRSLPPADQ